MNIMSPYNTRNALLYFPRTTLICEKRVGVAPSDGASAKQKSVPLICFSCSEIVSVSQPGGEKNGDFFNLPNTFLSVDSPSAPNFTYEAEQPFFSRNTFNEFSAMRPEIRAIFHR